MRRRRAIAAGLPVAALGAVAAAVVAAGGEAPAGRTAGTGAAHGIEVVQRRTLVESVQVDGTLGYGDPRPALDRVGGTLTWLPRAGAVIEPGQTLFAVDDRPVVLMDGTVPAWRTLESGVRDGADVRQLERNLAALGYDPGTVDDAFTAATATAVRAWQEDLDLPETGRVELGRVVFLPGARRVAEVKGSLGGGAGSGSGDGGGGAADAAWDGGGARMVPIADTGTAPSPGGATTPDDGGAAPGGTTTTPGPTAPTPPGRTTPQEKPPTGRGDGRGSGGTGGNGGGGGRGGPPGRGEGSPGAGDGPGGTAPGGGAPAGGAPGGADGGSGGGGGGGGAGAEVLATTSTTRVVTAQLDTADQALARVGRRAEVTLPDGSVVAGRIVEVGTVATADGDGGGGAGGGEDTAKLPVTIKLRSTRGAGRLDEAPVTVALARTTRRDVLAVPVEALIARAGGGYAVAVVRRGSAQAVEVPVQPGMFADGWVELTGGAVREGDRVKVPR